MKFTLVVTTVLESSISIVPEVAIKEKDSGQSIKYTSVDFPRVTKQFWSSCAQLIYLLDVYSLTIKSENSSYWCKTLPTSNSSTFCEQPGLLGHKCTTKCDQILGESYPFCEGYKICLDNGTCECSWGFKGTTCNQSWFNFEKSSKLLLSLFLGCTGDYWGRDCASTINSGNCESYNNTVGCFKCTKKFTGRQCAEKLPVVLKPPTLVSAKTNFAEISFDLTYGEDEKEPDFYQIQYKEVMIFFVTNFC